jgi:hypothetical protein
MKRLIVAALIGVPGIAGCTIDDGDRCPDGMRWNAEYASCECPVGDGYYLETDPDDPADAECLPCVAESTSPDCDTDTDTGDTETDTPDGGDDSGIGTTCSSSEDCADFEADYCALNPLAPEDPGYCTFENCESGECPDGYQCCDLTGLGLTVACLTDVDAEQAEGFGATCD